MVKLHIIIDFVLTNHPLAVIEFMTTMKKFDCEYISHKTSCHYTNNSGGQAFLLTEIVYRENNTRKVLIEKTK